MGCGSSSAREPDNQGEGYGKDDTILRTKDDFYNYYTLEEKLGTGM